MTAPYEMLDHTADLGMVIRGADLADLFSTAASALFAQITDLDAVRQEASTEIELKGDDWADLLHGWLSELLFLFETKELLFARFEVAMEGECALRARAWGEAYDRDRHPILSIVKAVTRHRLEVLKTENRWSATVIYDL